MIKIGVLNLQGDVYEHLQATKRALDKMNLKAQVKKVKTASEVGKCQGIIISGGESTVIGKLIQKENLGPVIKDLQIPVLGTCAGMVVSGTKTDYQQPLLGLIDMKVKRNGFGRQKLSFEKEIEIFNHPYPGIFIRAPYAEKIGEKVKVLATVDEKIVAVQQGRHIATAFHPELTEDTRIHDYFIKEVLNCVE